VYLNGPRKGQVRPSLSARRRWRAQAVEAARHRELGAAKRLAQEAEREEVERAKDECAGHGTACFLYRLGRGRRRRPESVTEFGLDSDDDGFEEGKLVALSREDVYNGRRCFREEYPEWWKEKYPPSDLADKALRSSSDVGKLFVEYHGVWYEAVAVGCEVVGGEALLSVVEWTERRCAVGRVRDDASGADAMQRRSGSSWYEQ
jgi:hypothetical protein